MQNAFNQNELSTLSINLLSSLDESVFFTQLSGYFSKMYPECSIALHKSFSDNSTQLRALNGCEVEGAALVSKGNSISGYVSRTKRAYYSNSVQRDPLFSMQEIPAGVVSELCVPVLSEGAILGTINIQGKEGYEFGQDDINNIMEALVYLDKPIQNMKIYLLATQMNEELIQKIQKNEEGSQSSRRGLDQFSQREEAAAIIGHSASIRNIAKIVDKVAKEDFPVLFEGEGGVGKKLLAQRIHSLSSRHKSPCISVNCSTMDDKTIESELFGTSDRKGLFELANGGTLILDEVSNLSIGVQNKLLRVLTSGEIFTVDGERNVPVNVRIISTSKESLEELASSGKFREEFLYRLNTISIKVPSLKERREDIKYLAEHFLNNNREKENYKVLTSRAIDVLNNYSWSGNVQELKSIIERTYILSEGKYIDEQDLPESIKKAPIVEESAQEEFSEMTLYDLERRHIVNTLEFLSGNKTKAAKSLGITVKTLYNKLHSYGILSAKKGVAGL